MRTACLLILSLLPFFTLSEKGFSQHPSNEKVFPDGVYFSFTQLANAKPGALPAQLRNKQNKQLSPKAWFRSDSLFCMINGQKALIPADSLYAFVEDGQLYLQRKFYAHKASVTGSLTYFTESYPVQSTPAPVSIDLAKDITPRILDFTTGKFLEYTVSTMEELLKERDEVLYQEFTGLSSQKLKRQLLLRYIEKYNERHPIFIKEEL